MVETCGAGWFGANVQRLVQELAQELVQRLVQELVQNLVQEFFSNWRPFRLFWSYQPRPSQRIRTFRPIAG
jgi:hypothetical protein